MLITALYGLILTVTLCRRTKKMTILIALLLPSLPLITTTTTNYYQTLVGILGSMERNDALKPV